MSDVKIRVALTPEKIQMRYRTYVPKQQYQQTAIYVIKKEVILSFPRPTDTTYKFSFRIFWSLQALLNDLASS